MAIFGLGVMVAPALGPVLGGYIVDNASWPLIFLINVPMGIATFLMALAFVPNPHYIERSRRAIDWPALGLMALGLISLQYVLERGQHEDWLDSQTIVALAVVSVTALVTFGVMTVRDRHPVVNLRIFRISSFSLGNVALFVVGFGLFGSELIVPLFFQSILGMTALDSGKALIPGAIATAVAMVVTSRTMNRIDARIPLVLGRTLRGLGELAARRVDLGRRHGQHVFPAYAGRLRHGPDVRSALSADALVGAARGNGRRNRALAAHSAARRQPRRGDHHDAALASNRDRLGGAGGRRNEDARRFRDDADEHGRAECQRDRLRLRLPHLRAALHRVDSDLAAAWAAGAFPRR